MKRLGLFLTSTLLTFNVFGGVADDMNNFFHSSGGQSNLSGPGAYKGQTAGLYSGGQVYARNRVRNIYPANIRLPSYSAGCGGIDAFTGSFSFISGDELMKSMESIASSATSYAFMLGIETISPHMAVPQKFLMNMASNVNSANINSCEAASSLVGGIWPKTDIAQNHICTATNSSSGFVSDWAKAKQGCNGKQTQETLTSTRAKEKGWDGIIVQDKNIAWAALAKNPRLMLAGNKVEDLNNETKELLMSISGTFIIRKESGKTIDNAASTKPSRADNIDFIKALLYGGSTIVYKCDEYTKCLNPKEENITISSSDSLKGKVTAIVYGIRNKIAEDKPLEKEEIDFLGATALPLYKMLNVEYAIGKDNDILNIDEYSALIASDILYQYLSENLEIMQYASESLMLMDEYMDRYRESIDKAKRNLNNVRTQNEQSLNQAMILIKQTQLLEQSLAGKLSSHLVGVIGYENGV